MRDITRAAEKYVSHLEADVRDAFESSIVHNRVSRAVQEDDRLRHTVDVVERAYELDERDDLPDEMDHVAFGAAEDLNDHLEMLVDMAVARECAAILTDACRDWFDESDIHDRVDVADAVDEAAMWLVENREAAEREGIDVDEVHMTSDDIDAGVSADV